MRLRAEAANPQDRLQLETDKAALLTATEELQSAIDRHGRNSAEAKAAEEERLELKKKVEADRAKLHGDERQRTALASDANKDLDESAKKPKLPRIESAASVRVRKSL